MPGTLGIRSNKAPAGYPSRGSDIKGLLGNNEVNKMPEINKIYGNGPQPIQVCLFSNLQK